MKKTLIALLLCLGSLTAQAALDPGRVRMLAAEDSSDKVTAIQQITQNADPDAVRVLTAMSGRQPVSGRRQGGDHRR